MSLFAQKGTKRQQTELKTLFFGFSENFMETDPRKSTEGFFFFLVQLAQCNYSDFKYKR